MKKILFLLFGILLNFSGISQSRFSLTITGGSDCNFSKYYDKTNYVAFDDGGTDYNVGMDISYKVSTGVAFRLESRYGHINYGQRRIGGEPTYKDLMKLEYMDLNPRIDIRVWQKSKLDVYVSTGFRLEYILDSDQKSFYADGSLSSTEFNYVDTNYDSSPTGWLVGARIKYNFTKHIALIFSPDYSLCFDKLYYQNSNSLSRFSTNVGIEWTF